MSTNKTTILEHNERLSALVETVENLPVVGGSNISYNTCTVEVSTNTDYHVTYLALENGIPTIKWTKGNNYTHTMENVICGSHCIVQVISTVPNYKSLINAEYLTTLGGWSSTKYMVFTITANQGETAMISCYDDD